MLFSLLRLFGMGTKFRCPFSFFSALKWSGIVERVFGLTKYHFSVSGGKTCPPVVVNVCSTNVSRPDARRILVFADGSVIPSVLYYARSSQLDIAVVIPRFTS